MEPDSYACHQNSAAYLVCLQVVHHPWFSRVPSRAVCLAMIVLTTICTAVVKDAIVTIQTASWGSIEEPTHSILLPPLALAIWLRAYHLQFGCTPCSFSEVLLLAGG